MESWGEEEEEDISDAALGVDECSE